MAYNPYIPWNDEMVVVLLNLVITEGVHLAHKNDTTKKWNKVNDLFFEQNELLPYKSAYRPIISRTFIYAIIHRCRRRKI